MKPPALTPKAVFDIAFEITSQAERSAFLDRACSSDPELRRKVEALLRTHEELGSFLERPAVAQPDTNTGSHHPSGDTPGGESVTVDHVSGPVHSTVVMDSDTQIGPYRLIEKLGEGGMGTVWRAAQEEPIRRQVALKIIKAGMDSAQVIARFEAERQALTLMNHENIARVLDAGTTSSARPFFVMELVEGVGITRFCDERKLTVRQRLELFLPVCQAVQHAHQKGIIHRDLKPSNVLVTLADGKAVPKVIDFGIAKATQQKLTDHTLATEFGSIMGTLEYMSPEQAGLNEFDIDTRSDVYALGVILYELLTGTTPLEKKVRKEKPLLEVLRIIREEPAPRPSVRLGKTEEKGTIAANRGLEPAKLSGQLRRELDWIVLKALEKERNRRYESVGGFVEDIQRYLADEPVKACPPSAVYQVGKFIRKQRVAAGFIGMSVTLVVVLALTLILVDTARRQETKAREKAETSEMGTHTALVLSDSLVQVLVRNQRD